MTWAYRNQPAADWTYHLNVCRWLLGSAYRTRINEEPIEAFMAAAAASWINTDHSQAEGIVLAWRALRVFDWKVTPPAAVEQPPLPASGWDFAWSPLSRCGECYGWQVLT